MNKRMFFAMGLVLFLVSGCSSFRGLPSHGGGKRFDEEQRVVASAVRRAAGRMDLSELRGLRVRVILVSIPTSGAGNVNWGGLQSVGLSGKLGGVDHPGCEGISRGRRPRDHRDHKG